MPQHSMGTEAIRAFFSLQCCWLNDEEIFLHPDCQTCGAAATYLMYFSNQHIQHLILEFVAKYSCSQSGKIDLLDLTHFEHDYDDFLQLLEKEVNFYARQHHELPRRMCFEEVGSIFNRIYGRVCSY